MEALQIRADKRKVIFAVKAPFANEVILMGDFNDWDATLHSLKRDGNGVWKVPVFLSPGTYEYKLKVDGRWWEDISHDRTVQNPFGTFNRVIVVPEKA